MDKAKLWTNEGRNLFSVIPFLHQAFPLPCFCCAKIGKNVHPYFLGFPFGEALPRSGGGEVPLGFPLRAFLAELPFQGSFGSLAVRAAD